MKFKIFDLKYNKCLKEIGVQRFDAKSKNRSSAKLTMQNVATFSFDIFDAHVDIEILRVRSFCTIQIRIPKIWIFWISCDNGMENLKSDFWSFVIEAQG